MSTDQTSAPTPPATLTEAIVAFQAELPRVQKGSRNDHFKSTYADLADVVGVVLPALARQGLAWVTIPTMTKKGFVLLYSLQHVSGERIDGRWPLPDPTQSNAQVVGSAVTYAKRYALSAVTGVAPDEDDDGNTASKPAAPPADWKQQIAKSSSVAALTEIYQQADSGGWKTEQVLAALNARRAVLGAAAQNPAGAAVPNQDAPPSAATPAGSPSEMTQEDYEAAEAARFDAGAGES